MNHVGIQGKGESVWLAWFLIVCFDRFKPIAERRGDTGTVKKCVDRAEALAKAIDEQAWDGEWYRRAYFDDGTPLGSSLNTECRIDSLSQSWAVISGRADPARARHGIASALQHLVRRDNRMILLLEPPFDNGVLHPGYIKGYLPGIRENGGQYTHGALWLVKAVAKLGDGDQAMGLLDLLNPIRHSDTAEKVAVYHAEPYVIAADVYSLPPHVGQAGWTWYTGSAAWFHRVGLETILGFKRHGDKLRIEPCVPSTWSGFEIVYRYKTSTYQIQVENPPNHLSATTQIWVDGAESSSKEIALEDDGKTHDVRVRLGR